MPYGHRDRKRHPFLQPTERQLQVFANFLLHGTKEAAVVLDIAEQTVKNTLTDLYIRLGVESQAQAAVALGWLDIPDGYVHSLRRKGQLKPRGRQEQAERLLNYANTILDELEAMR